MTYAIRLAAVALALATSAVHAQKTCPMFNNSKQPAKQVAVGIKEHLSGNHNVYMNPTFSCTYEAQPYTNQCASRCEITVTGDALEAGSTAKDTNLLYLVHHAVNDTEQDGVASGNGSLINCGGQLDGAVRSCSLINVSCDMSVSISGSVSGIGGSLTFSASPLWNRDLTYNNFCAARESTTGQICPSPTSAPPTTFLPGSYTWLWNTAGCTWTEVPCSYVPTATTCEESPIVIDTAGEGFQFTSVENGVKFDFYGNGNPIQIAWTKKGSKNGWLALPNKDGTITSARQLFGNVTAQAIVPDHEQNGFAAMAVWDAPSVGGNNNGLIDPNDAIWGKLRIWIDSNHNAVVDPGELSTLDQIGLAYIDLKYHITPHLDAYGNQLRYQGHLKPLNPKDNVDRKIVDVILKSRAL